LALAGVGVLSTPQKGVDQVQLLVNRQLTNNSVGTGNPKVCLAQMRIFLIINIAQMTAPIIAPNSPPEALVDLMSPIHTSIGTHYIVGVSIVVHEIVSSVKEEVLR
jgi:hypothetical protein